MVHNPVWPSPSRGLAKPDGCPFDSAVKSAIEDILAILHTQKKLSDKDATSVGLLKKMNTAFLFCTVYSEVFAS